MVQSRERGLIVRLVRWLTFVDQPIRRKFSLFALGVLFWFVLLSCVSFYVLVDVNIKTSEVVDKLLPYERFAQDTLRKSYEMNRLVDDLKQAGSEQIVTLKAQRLKSALEGICSSIEQLEVARIHSPMRMLWNRFTANDWFDEQGNSTYFKVVKKTCAELAQQTSKLTYMKLDQIRNRNNVDVSQIDALCGHIVALETDLANASVEFLESISAQTNNYSSSITTMTSYAFWMMMTVLALASGLLAIFTFWISDSIVLPVTSIITKIHTLATGHVDLTDKIAIRSDDEIGQMSREFNDLMDTVHGMTVFKSVIEEDATLEDVYSRMGEAFSTNVGIEQYRIFEVSADYKRMTAVFPLAVSEDDIDCDSVILTSCECCRAVKTGHAISSLGYDGVCKQFKYPADKVHVCIPMIIGGHAGGVVQFVFDKDGEHAVSRSGIEQRVAKAEAYIKQSLSVLEAKRLMNTLRESSLRDPMTGLFNRRFLQEQSNYLVAGTLRREKNVGLLMCDIDYFKQVNDKYGHDAGDEILKGTASIICDNVRESDIVIRFGGEEFLVILTDINNDDAMLVAEKIRRAVEAKVFRIGSEKVSKTISIGVSEFPVDSDGFWQAIKFADVALYAAKDGGRNRTVRFEASMWDGDEF